MNKKYVVASVLGIALVLAVCGVVYWCSIQPSWHQVAWVTSENPTETFTLHGAFKMQLLCDSAAWVSIYSANSGKLEYYVLINPWESIEPNIAYHGEVYLEVEPVLDVDEWEVMVSEWR